MSPDMPVPRAGAAAEVVETVDALSLRGVSHAYDTILAVDGVGAGVGDTVMITSDGRGARELLQTDITPVRWTIIGIQDDDRS